MIEVQRILAASFKLHAASKCLAGQEIEAK
jgi:hypothetical protein